MSGQSQRPLREHLDWDVLIIDDMHDNLQVAKTVLAYHGARVYTASNGPDGLALLNQITPTLVLLDIRMPMMDGFTVFQRIRSFSNVPVIAITAYAMEESRRHIAEAGFDSYIIKPFNVLSLVDELKKALAAHAGKA